MKSQSLFSRKKISKNISKCRLLFIPSMLSIGMIGSQSFSKRFKYVLLSLFLVYCRYVNNFAIMIYLNEIGVQSVHLLFFLVSLVG